MHRSRIFLGIGKVEDYLDSATSGTHFGISRTRSAAEALNTIAARLPARRSSTPVPTQLPSTPVPTQFFRDPGTDPRLFAMGDASSCAVSNTPSAGYGNRVGRQQDCPADWSSCIQDSDEEYVVRFAQYV